MGEMENKNRNGNYRKVHETEDNRIIENWNKMVTNGKEINGKMENRKMGRTYNDHK